jgi:methylglutaconyl-CoA hydratase
MNATAAHEYFLTGAPFSASEAAAGGLVNRAVPAESLDDAVASYTSALVKGGPSALAAAKQLRRTVPFETEADAFRRLEELSARHFGSVEGKDGITAMLAKQPAPWVPSE